MPLDIGAQSLPVLFLLLAVAGAITWYSATRITHYVDAIAKRAGLGQAFAGMLLLGGATSLPEIATAGTASVSGNPLLSVNDLIGSASINLLLLAVGDAIYGRDALTSVAGRPVTLMQGVLGMILFAGVAFAIAVEDIAIPYLGVGAATLLLAVAAIRALRIARRFENANTWQLVDPVDIEQIDLGESDLSNGRLAMLTTLAATGIFAGGALLAMTGDAIAEETGLGTSIIGFTLVALATSLPEFSTVMAALKLRRYQMAIGDIFGTNLFNIQILFLVDLLYRDGAILNQPGPFEVAACCLAAVLTGIFIVGLLERRDRTILRVGMDSALVIAAFVGGLAGLSLVGGTA